MKARVLSLLVPAALLLPVVAHAFDDGDFQNWSTVYVEHKVASNLTLKVEEEVRLGDDASERFYYHTDVGLTRSVLKWLDLALGYRQIKEKVGGDWKDEYQPYGNVIFKGDVVGFHVEDRNRVEYRIREDRDDMLRYRNRVQVLHHVKVFGLAFDPYVSEEAFIDTDAGDFNQFRTIGGFKAKLTDSIRSDIYYVWQAVDKSNEWTDTNVLGLRFGYVF